MIQMFETKIHVKDKQVFAPHCGEVTMHRRRRHAVIVAGSLTPAGTALPANASIVALIRNTLML